DTPDAAVATGTTGTDATGDSCGAASSDLRTEAGVGVDVDEATGAAVELGDAGEDAAEAGRNRVVPFEPVGDGVAVVAVPVFTWAAALSDTGDTRDTGLLATVEDG